MLKKAIKRGLKIFFRCAGNRGGGLAPPKTPLPSHNHPTKFEQKIYFYKKGRREKLFRCNRSTPVLLAGLRESFMLVCKNCYKRSAAVTRIL